MKDNEISKSINNYINYTNRCQQIKICMNPIEYLNGLKKSNYFEVINKFCKSEKVFHNIIKNIQNMLIMGYINYSNTNNSNQILYRVVSKVELDYLKEHGIVNEFLSTFKYCNNEMKNFLSYTQSNDKYNYLLSLYVKGNIPSIDTYKCANPLYEANEIILIPSFKISNLDEIYNDNNLITMSADIISNIQIENIPYSILLDYYNEIVKDINIYSKYIEQYLLNKNDIFSCNEYIIWANKLKDYINMLNKYIGYNVLENEINIDNYQKIKVI